MATLIANTGIQLEVYQLEIDLNTRSRRFFHEWFDEDNVEYNLEMVYQLPDSQKVYRTIDLESHDYLSLDGKLKVEEDEILATPDIDVLYEGDIDDNSGIFSLRLNDARCSKIEELKNKWLPLPYYELDGFKNGPYNWVRCKLIPRESRNRDKLSVYLLLAVDTRAIYRDTDEYRECPSFVSNTERRKNFKLDSSTRGLFNFLSGENFWIRDYLMNVVHGGTKLDGIRVENGDFRYSFLATYMLLIKSIDSQNVLPEIQLIRDRDVNYLDTEMIIDIGNSRTAAILFEENDFTKVKPLQIQNFSKPLLDGKLNRTQESFDMRVAFQKVTFGEKALGGSNQFVWPSIVRLGTEAELLTNEVINLEDGDEILSTYSSPKRYLWDTKSRREEWRCVKLDSSGKTEEPRIEGVSNYLSNDGSINKDGTGFGFHYSRKSLMTLAFIEILTQAKVQINSEEYREFHGRVSTPRRLNKIILTCPTAMSKKEQQSLHDCLTDAIYILNKFYENIDSENIPLEIKVIPNLSKKRENSQWIFDEATCSQFVYLYGQFAERYLNNSKDFFNIYGQERINKEGERRDSIIIGSLDIGAGTSDIMICQYEYNSDITSKLKPVPIFWDSFDYAGDDMMKVLVENILIQGKNGILEKELIKRGIDEVEVSRKLNQFFGSNQANMSFKDRIIRRDFNLQVCVPIINYFLNLLSCGILFRNITFEEIFKETKPSELVLSRFEEYFGFPLQDICWEFDSKNISQQIEFSMNSLLENVATIMYAYDCDLVLLSGRPTSLPPVKDIFLRYFNKEPDRLVLLNKYRIGRWYPFADAFGYLTNSKSVVPVGAMIGYLASNFGGITNFSLDLSVLGEKLKPTTEYFLLNSDFVMNNQCFITPEKSDGELTLNSFPVYIGSKQFDLALYPIRPFYVLEINDDGILKRIIEKNKERKLNDSDKQILLQEEKERLLSASNLPFKFTIERRDYEENKEYLVISSIEDNNGSNIPTDNFTLSVQSLNDPDCYWLDSGIFNIGIRTPNN